MPSEDRDTRQGARTVDDRGAGNADLQAAIDKVCTALLAIEDSLSPIIGARGMAALYQRSIYLAARTHAVLAAAHDDDALALDLVPLRHTLAGQTPADAAAAGDALLRTFHDLVASLIGPSLTERLLRSVWTDSSSAPNAQDTPP